jgi:hypothetical protein
VATPTSEIFFVYNLTDGTPRGGLVGTLAFSFYKDETGADVSPPTFTQIAPGAYKFTPVFPSPGVHGIVYMINAGAGSNPPFIARYMRSEDYASDGVPAIATSVTGIASTTTSTASDVTTIKPKIQDLHDMDFGQHSVNTSGPDANKLVVKRPDTTVLQKFALTDKDGNPAYRNVTTKTPTT